jgi:hypothetical protein
MSNSDDDGLHEKYDVYEDNEPVQDCFVLRPHNDPAAKEALLVYAEQTDNKALAQDLRDWVNNTSTEGEQFTPPAETESDNVECNYCGRSELAYRLESGRGTVVRCIPCLAIERGQQALGMPFDEWLDRDIIEPMDIDSEPAFEPYDPREMAYYSVRSWFKILARINDDEPLVKRDPSAPGTIHEDTREFLINIMGSEAHKVPSKLVGQSTHTTRLLEGEEQ